MPFVHLFWLFVGNIYSKKGRGCIIEKNIILMKKLLVLSVLLSSLLFSCKKNDAPTPEQLTKNKLVGKWNWIKYGDENPIGSQEVFTNTSGSYEILENGTMIITITGIAANYTWTVVDATHFQNVETGQIYTIEQLDDTTLKLAYDNVKNGVAGKRHLYFTRIP